MNFFKEIVWCLAVCFDCHSTSKLTFGLHCTRVGEGPLIAVLGLAQEVDLRDAAEVTGISPGAGVEGRFLPPHPTPQSTPSGTCHQTRPSQQASCHCPPAVGKGGTKPGLFFLLLFQSLLCQMSFKTLQIRILRSH